MKLGKFESTASELTIIVMLCIFTIFFPIFCLIFVSSNLECSDDVHSYHGRVKSLEYLMANHIHGESNQYETRKAYLSEIDQKKYDAEFMIQGEFSRKYDNETHAMVDGRLVEINKAIRRVR